MSLDPKTLKHGDVLVFGGKIARIVRRVYEISEVVFFKDSGEGMNFSDPFWQIAEPKKPELPRLIHYAISGEEYLSRASGIYSPSKALRSLKEDVAKLEAAGVTE